MKIQSLAVIFAIIILPVIIILSYFIQSSIDTIAIQNAYDTKLMDATHDAMVSFELNTANENLSAVSDSLRSIIEASTNVFFNTLATNLGMSNASKSYVQNYIPAILYTLYDGYYIYSPTRVPIILTAYDEKVVYVGDRGVTYCGTDSETGHGIYQFDEDEYNKEIIINGNNDENKDRIPDQKESEDAKSLRQTALYNSLPANIKYEFGQMLYKNKDGLYNAVINEKTVYNQDYVLKSYMPYSARYLSEDGATTEYDITLNYTLDNYLTVEGYIGDIYYSKTGYLIAKDVVKSITAEKKDADGNVIESVPNLELLKYNEDRAEEICLTGEYDLSLKIQPMMEDGVTRTEEIELVYEVYKEADGRKLTAIELEEKLDKLYAENIEIGLIQDIEARLANLKAITYYVKSQIFSNWVYENLGEDGIKVKGKNIAKDIAELNAGIFTTTNEMDIFHDFSEDDELIFNSSINPEKEDSPFYSHKLNVIKNAIQYNLNLAISSYDIMVKQMDIQMPVMTDDEWDKILNNVSIVSFMQGFNCGMKIYNNYSIVSSTNNELTVIPNEIYYTKENEYNTADTSHLYHRIDCEALVETDEAGQDLEYISFRSKEIKYDKIYDKNSKTYKYDHRNNGCYSCIVNSNYLKTIKKDDSDNEIKGYSDDIIISMLSPEKQKEYYRAVAKERQNLYKTNALTNSNGYEVVFTAASDTSNTITFGEGETINDIPLTKNPSSKEVNKIKEIELTIRDLQETDTDKDEATATFRAVINGTTINQDFIVNLDQVTPQTIVIPVHPVHIEDTNKLTGLKLIKTNPDDGIKCNVLSVRVIYE